MTAFWDHAPRMLGTQVVGVNASHALRLESWPHRDELRQVVAQGTESVVDPRAEGRIAAVEQVPAREEFHLGAVVIVGREHRPDHGDVVNTIAQMRPPVTDGDPALSPSLEPDLRGIDPGLPLVDDVVGDLLPDVLEVRRLKDGQPVRGLANRLARMPVERGLGVKTFEVADTAAHHQPDDPPGSRRMRRPVVGCGPIGPIAGKCDPVAVQHRSQYHADESHPHVCQECPARLKQLVRGFYPHCGGSRSTDRDKVVVVQEHMHECRPGAGFRRRAGSGRFVRERAGKPFQSHFAFGSLRVGWRPANDVLKGGDHKRPAGRKGRIHTNLAVDRLGNLSGAGQDHAAVGHRQRLLGHDRLMAAVAVLDVGGVEHRQERDALVACHAVIDCSAGARLGGLDGQVGAAHRRIELAGQEQERVADDLALHAAGAHPPDVPVVGVDPEVRVVRTVGRRSHPIGPRSEDQSVQMLETPAGFHEFDGQPVEKIDELGRGREVRSQRWYSRAARQNGEPRRG